MILFQCEHCENTSYVTMKTYNEIGYEPLMACNVCEKQINKMIDNLEIKQEKLKDKVYTTVFTKTPEKKESDHPHMYEWIDTENGSQRLVMSQEYKKFIADKNDDR